MNTPAGTFGQPPRLRTPSCPRALFAARRIRDGAAGSSRARRRVCPSDRLVQARGEVGRLAARLPRDRSTAGVVRPTATSRPRRSSAVLTRTSKRASVARRSAVVLSASDGAELAKKSRDGLLVVVRPRRPCVAGRADHAQRFFRALRRRRVVDPRRRVRRAV